MATLNVIPTNLGKYLIRGVLGRGAMGTVYDGWDPVIGRRVAVKTVRLLEASDQEAQEAAAQFRNEAQAAGRLSHPHIVSVYDYGEADDTAFIVMEFIEGRSLKDMLDAGERLPVGETVRIMAQVLTALQFSHGKGVIHRDIKPGNVMLTADGEAKLTDFGIARIESSVMTQAGTILGTPAYMSPEQLMGQPVDARTDIYSAGVLLYQLLTGERPFEGGLPAIIHKAMNTVPPRPSEMAVTVPPGLDTVVATAMARRPDDRYPNARAFSQALRETFDGTVSRSSRADTGWESDKTVVLQSSRPVRHSPINLAAPRSRRRSFSPALLGGLAAVLLLVAGSSAWLALLPGRAPAPGPAEQAVVSAPPEPSAGGPPAEASAEPGRTAGAPATETASPAMVPTESTPAPALTLNQPPPAPVQPPPSSEPPPSPVPNPAPAQLAVAVPDPQAIRDSLMRLAASCALPRFSVSDEGRVGVSGLVGAGTPSAALRDAVEAATPGVPLTWEARSVEGPYCGVLDLIRPISRPSSPFLAVALADDVTRLKSGDQIRPILKLPEFPAYVTVDYFSSDGSVGHLLPVRGAPARPMAANATLRVEDLLKDRLEVGPPFGTDMIVAIASLAPLFPPGQVRADEKARTYLPVLAAALEAAAQRGARVTGRVLVVDTAGR